MLCYTVRYIVLYCSESHSCIAACHIMPMLCYIAVCHISCKTSCTGDGPQNCDECKEGWLHDTEKGCQGKHIKKLYIHIFLFDEFV